MVTRHSEVATSRSQVLRVEDLSKSYGAVQALRGLSFSLTAGRVMGLLGPNGAGKTTAIRILTTILEPSSGDFFVNGISSEYPEKIRHQIGVLPESLGFPRQITGIEYLTYFGQLYSRTATQARTHGLSLLKEVGLEQRAKSLIGTYSRGMRQRLGIARVLINDPVVIFLDEPTLGLDPRGQQELLSLVRRIAREQNVGIVLCSHLLSEVEDVCDDVVILRSGQVVAAGSIAEVIQRAQRNVHIRVPSPMVSQARQVLETVPNIMKASLRAGTADWLEMELIDPGDKTQIEESQIKNTILEALISAKIPILSFEAEGGRLQDVFLQLTKESTV